MKTELEQVKAAIETELKEKAEENSKRWVVTLMELHNPLFMFKNHGSRLDVKKTPKLRIEYDVNLQAALVIFQGGVSIIPNANISSMLLQDPYDVGVRGMDQRLVPTLEPVINHPMLSDIGSAQIETPSQPKEGARFQAEYKGKA
jgi:hypothetical protein